MNETLTLMACQIDIPAMLTVAERDAHLATSANKLRAKLATCQEKIDLVALPELSGLDYSRETFAQLPALAEPLEGASFHTWRAVAMEFGVYVSYGFAQARQDGPRIANAVIGPDGALVGHYNKLHLAQYGASMEKEYFNRGDHLFSFEINGFRIAPIICYDIRIPELSRTLTVDHDVHLILHSGAYYRDESFETWHPFAITRAIENQVFFMSLNRAGKNYGNSLFCPPWQDETIRPTRFADTSEDIRVMKLMRATLDRARAEYSFLDDRMQDYRALKVTKTT